MTQGGLRIPFFKGEREKAEHRAVREENSFRKQVLLIPGCRTIPFRQADAIFKLGDFLQHGGNSTAGIIAPRSPVW